MTSARPISELYEGFSDEELRSLRKGQELLLMEYDLVSKLRKERQLTQKELADVMEIRQSAISKLERQEDILVQTLARYIEALGGELEVTAKFADREVKLTQFVRRNVGEEVRAH